MTARQRRAALFVVLAAVVGWSAWLAVGDEESSATDDAASLLPAARTERAASPAPTPAKRASTAETAPRLALSSVDLFPEQTWYVAPPPPPPPPPAPYVPPPPPEAPPLPYSYIGRWQDGAETTYYLARGALPVSVRAGQVLDGVWKLETASDGVLSFVYLPLNQTRSLRTGD